MSKYMVYIDKANQMLAELRSSDANTLRRALSEIAKEWIENDADDASSSVGNYVLWRAHPLLFAVLAEQQAIRSEFHDKKVKLLMQAINCYTIAQQPSLARACAEHFLGLSEITEALLRQANNGGNQKSSPLYCAVLYEIVAKMSHTTVVNAKELCTYEFASYFYALVGEYQLAVVCIQPLIQCNVPQYMADLANKRSSDNPLFAAIVYDLLAQRLLKDIGCEPAYHSMIIQNCKDSIYYYALANQVELLKSRVDLIRYIGYITSEVVILLNNKERTAKAPLMAAVVFEKLGGYREAARYYSYTANLEDMRTCVQKAVDNDPGLKSNDWPLAGCKKDAPLYYKAMRECLLAREQAEPHSSNPRHRILR